jgi:hypothetical protein
LIPQEPRRFLNQLLSLSPPAFVVDRGYLDPTAADLRAYVRRVYAVLAPRTGCAFLPF